MGGKMGYHLMVVPYAQPNPEVLVGRIQLFTQTRQAHGYTDAPEILGVYHFYCGETAAKAKEEPREAMMRYINAVAASNQEAAYSDQYRPYQGLKDAFKTFDYEGYLYPHKVIFGDPGPVRRTHQGNPGHGHHQREPAGKFWWAGARQNYGLAGSVRKRGLAQSVVAGVTPHSQTDGTARSAQDSASDGGGLCAGTDGFQS